MNAPSQKRMGFRVRKGSINYTVRYFNVIRDGLHNVQDAYHWGNMKQVYNKAYGTSMLATGELRSKLFKVRRKDAAGSTHIVGYDQTSNDQSVSQEFEEGKVHRQEKHHWHSLMTERGDYVAAKCSRAPVDLWSFKKSYDANPRARRRALALSIEETFTTRVRYAANSGGDMHYVPSLKNYERTISVFTANVLNQLSGGS